jgi:hypothetical protein
VSAGVRVLLRFAPFRWPRQRVLEGALSGKEIVERD